MSIRTGNAQAGLSASSNLAHSKLFDFDDTNLESSMFSIVRPTVLQGYGLCLDASVCVQMMDGNACDGYLPQTIRFGCGCALCLSYDNNVIIIPFPGQFRLKRTDATPVRVVSLPLDTGFDVASLMNSCGSCSSDGTPAKSFATGIGTPAEGSIPADFGATVYYDISQSPSIQWIYVGSSWVEVR